MKRKLSALTAILLLFSLNICGCQKDNSNTSGSSSANEAEETAALSIHHFNAGKADACIISEGEHYVMIDTGESTLSDELISYFSKNNINSLDYLIITHFDKDHVGSASTVIEQLDVENVLQSNVPKSSEYYDNYLTALDEKNITPVTVSGNYEFELGDMSFNVNGPDIVYDSNESNNSSLITSLYFGDSSFIFMGDAQNDRLKDFISVNTTKYDYVKIPYHGNYQKKLDNLLENIEPVYAVITSSEEEPEREEMLEILNDMGIKYYLTREGAIDVTSDGKTMKIFQETSN